MNAAGDRPLESIAIAELALSQLTAAHSVSPDVKEAIIGDAAALRLSRRVIAKADTDLALPDTARRLDWRGTRNYGAMDFTWHNRSIRWAGFSRICGTHRCWQKVCLD